MQGLTELPLRDIKLPQDPSYWPLAPGWWILIAIFLIFLVFAFKLYLKRKRKNKIRMTLMNELNQIQKQHKAHKSDHQLASDISLFLKRIIQFGTNNNSATKLDNELWFKHLNQLLPKHSIQDFKEELQDAIWNPKAKVNSSGLIAATKDFANQLVKKGILEL